MHLCEAVTRERIRKSPESRAGGTRTWLKSPRSRFTPRTVDAISGSSSVTYEIIDRGLMTGLFLTCLGRWPGRENKFYPTDTALGSWPWGLAWALRKSYSFWYRSMYFSNDQAVNRYCQSLCKIPLFTSTKILLTENTIFLPASSISKRLSRIAKRKIHSIKGERRRRKASLNVGQV